MAKFLVLIAQLGNFVRKEVHPFRCLVQVAYFRVPALSNALGTVALGIIVPRAWQGMRRRFLALA